MGEFFKGWRRKIGLGALVVAMSLSAFWLSCGMTSMPYGTVFYRGAYPLPDGASENIFDRVVTKEGILVWETFRANGPLQVYDDQIAQWDKSLPTRTRTNCVLVTIDEHSNEWHWKWKSSGFEFGEFRQNHPDGFTMARCGIPFWSIVLPLTLLSAYLLIRKQPIAKPTSAPQMV